MKKFLSEFKEFAMRGNVFDMAVGVIIGGAFGTITTTLVNNVFMPLIGMIFGGIDLAKLDIILKPAITEMVDGQLTETTPAVILGLGTFLSAVINFILIAFVVFMMVKGMNKLHKKEEPAPEPPAGPTSEELLSEIRDLLKETHKE